MLSNLFFKKYNPPRQVSHVRFGVDEDLLSLLQLDVRVEEVLGAVVVLTLEGLHLLLEGSDLLLGTLGLDTLKNVIFDETNLISFKVLRHIPSITCLVLKFLCFGVSN